MKDLERLLWGASVVAAVYGFLALLWPFDGTPDAGIVALLVVAAHEGERFVPRAEP